MSCILQCQPISTFTPKYMPHGGIITRHTPSKTSLLWQLEHRFYLEGFFPHHQSISVCSCDRNCEQQRKRRRTISIHMTAMMMMSKGKIAGVTGSSALAPGCNSCHRVLVRRVSPVSLADITLWIIFKPPDIWIWNGTISTVKGRLSRWDGENSQECFLLSFVKLWLERTVVRSIR